MNNLSFSHYIVFALVLLLAIASALLSSGSYINSFDLIGIPIDDPYTVGFYYGLALMFSILLLKGYVQKIDNKVKLFGISVTAVIVSSLAFAIAFPIFIITQAYLGLVIAGFLAGAAGGFVTSLPLKFINLIKQNWHVAVLGGILGVIGSVLAFVDFSGGYFGSPSYNEEYLLSLFLVWQIGMSTYLVFRSFRTSRYN